MAALVEVPLGKLLFTGDPALSCRFYIPSLPYGLPSAFVKAVNVNYPTLQTETHNVAATTFKYPTGFECDAISISFWEDRDMTTSTGLEAWRKAAVDDNGIFGLPVQYKKDIIVAVLDPAYPIVKKFVQFQKCFTLGVPTHSYDVDESGAVLIEAQFEVQRARVYTPSNGR